MIKFDIIAKFQNDANSQFSNKNIYIDLINYRGYLIPDSIVGDITMKILIDERQMNTLQNPA